MSFDNWTFEELVNDYARAREWLRSLGVQVEGTRYASIATYTELMLESFRAQDASLFLQDPDCRIGVYSLLEAREIVEIHETFENDVTPGLRKRLQQAAIGPDPGVAESGEDGMGRDQLAEVFWAALLRRAGSKVVLPPDSNAPDVVQHLPIVGRDKPAGLVWEVKRPRGEAGVRGAIEKASDQVRRAKLGEKPTGTEVVGGFPVIFVDYAVSEKLYIKGLNRDMVGAAAGEFLREWAHLRKGEAQFYGDSDAVAGIVYVWRALGVCPLPGGSRDAIHQVIRVQGDPDVGAAERWVRDAGSSILASLRPPR